MKKMFLADAMLKKLAEWLRILGVSVEYDYVVGKPDSRIMAYAKRKKLILLTRDARMVPSLVKRKVPHLLIASTDAEEQIAQVLCTYGYKITFPKNTRCPKCNGNLRILFRIPKGEAPPDVYAHKRKFWKCQKCGKLYWKGGHWKNMGRTISKVRTLLKTYV